MLHGGGKEGEGVVGNFLTCFSTSIVLLSWQCRSGWEEKEEGEESYSAVPNIILPPVPLPPTRDPSTPSKLMEEAGEEDKWTMEESQWELVGGDPSPLHARKGRRKMEGGGETMAFVLSSFPPPSRDTFGGGVTAEILFLTLPRLSPLVFGWCWSQRLTAPVLTPERGSRLMIC